MNTAIIILLISYVILCGFVGYCTASIHNLKEDLIEDRNTFIKICDNTTSIINYSKEVLAHTDKIIEDDKHLINVIEKNIGEINKNISFIKENIK